MLRPSKEKVYIISIVVLVLLLIATNIEFKEKPQKEARTEEYTKDCEIWKICDYRDAYYGCTALECPQVFNCWEIQKNCKEVIQTL
mgnify:CR=1 FL=1